jgi:hypothetical protein
MSRTKPTELGAFAFNSVFFEFHCQLTAPYTYYTAPNNSLPHTMKAVLASVHALLLLFTLTRAQPLDEESIPDWINKYFSDDGWEVLRGEACSRFSYLPFCPLPPFLCTVECLELLFASRTCRDAYIQEAVDSKRPEL